MHVVAERSVMNFFFVLPLARVDAQRKKISSMKPGRKTTGGEIGSENADMSSDKECERHSRRKSKGSCLKLI